MRRVRRTIGVLLLVLLVPLAALWIFQRRIVFQPDTAHPGPAADHLPGAVDVTLETADGLDLTAWYLPSTGCGVTVLVAPGNAGHRAGRVPLAAALGAHGLGVLLLDYRGYGGNPGRPSEDGLRADADAAAAFLAENTSDRVLYFGESLGGAVVVGLAERVAPTAVVLRSPFVDLAAAASEQFPWLPVRAMLWDELPVQQVVSRLSVPVTVVYGERDSLIPPEQSRAVAVSGGGRAVMVPGADHNDAALAYGPLVVEAVLAAAGC